MNKQQHFSEEQLNAFVDGELEPEEKGRLYTEAETSEELDRRLCQQRKLKELVRHAYEDVPQPQRTHHASLRRSTLLGRMIAAGVLLMLGVAGGFMIHSEFDRDAAAVAANPSIAATQSYILHVASGDAASMGRALEYAQTLLDSGPAGRQVEIVANEKGLDLLRRDVTPYAQQIRALAEAHVVFYACSRTIQRLEERGVDVMLVPEARTDYTALDRVVLRMKDGWKYEKI